MSGDTRPSQFDRCIRMLSLAFVAFLSGCAERPVPQVRPGEPISVQLQRAEPALVQQRFFNLLSFENESDTVFIDTADGTRSNFTRLDGATSHTGAKSLLVAEPWRGMSVRTDALLASSELAGEWTLMGGYFYCERAAEVRMAFVDPAAGSERMTVVNLKPNEWTPVFVDAATERPTTRPLDVVSRLRVEFSSPAPVRCDDLMLIENTANLQSGAAGDDSAWSITLRGKRYFGRTASGEPFEVAAKIFANDSGWTLTQVDAMRCVFRDGARTWTVYAGGRAYLDGVFQPVISGADVVGMEQHTAPGEIELQDESVRVIRNSPGDADNDGYNEALGAYELQARSSRINFTFTPHSSRVDRPIVEVAGIPPGRVLVTVEGRLVDRWVRTSSGTILFELPGDVRRPVAVSVSTRAEQAGLVP